MVLRGDGLGEGTLKEALGIGKVERGDGTGDGDSVKVDIEIGKCNRLLCVLCIQSSAVANPNLSSPKLPCALYESRARTTKETAELHRDAYARPAACNRVC